MMGIFEWMKLFRSYKNSWILCFAKALCVKDGCTVYAKPKIERLDALDGQFGYPAIVKGICVEK